MKLIIQLLTPFKTMIRKILCDIILIADNNPTFLEKVKYLITLICTFAPIAYLLNGVSDWFTDNKSFVAFVSIAIAINIVVGWQYHKKMGTFSWELFFKRNGLMIFILIITYILLEMLRVTIGPGLVGDGFKALIQVSTLLYPSSKALKNLYILSNKQFPPSFIMERLYNFEKTGNINDLFPEKKNNQYE